MTPELKLTKKQKEIVAAMQKKEHLLTWQGVPLCRFRFGGKTLRYDLASGLRRLNLIEKNPLSRSYNDYSLTLTTLGRTLKLD